MKRFDIIWHDDVIIIENRRYKAGDLMTTYLNLNIDRLDSLVAACSDEEKKQEACLLTDKLISKLPPMSRLNSEEADAQESCEEALKALCFCRDKAGAFFDAYDEAQDMQKSWNNVFGAEKIEMPDLCSKMTVSDGAVGYVMENAGFAELVYLIFARCASSGIKPRRCGCCNKYFIPSNPIAKFCDRKAPDSSGKTCREVGARKRYGEKTKNDPIITIYNRAYKTRYARMTNGRMTREQMNIWKTQASSLREKALSGAISAEKFEDKLSKI